MHRKDAQMLATESENVRGMLIRFGAAIVGVALIILLGLLAIAISMPDFHFDGLL